MSKENKFVIMKIKTILILVGICVLWTGLIMRLYNLQIKNSSILIKKADRQHTSIIRVKPRRGKIVDKNNNTLAVSLKVKSVFCVPSEIKDIWSTSKKLSKVLSMERNLLIKKLTKNSKFAWIKRKISDSQLNALNKLKIKGIHLTDEVKRFYPKSHLLSHVLGFVNIDNKGMDGIERTQNSILKGTEGKTLITKDAKGREIVSKRKILKKPRNGANIILTIDEVIQNIAEEALDDLCEKFDPKAVSAIVMDVRSGDILALSNRPTYDLNNVGSTSAIKRKNSAVVNAYEPGSLFKVISAAAAMNEKAVGIDEVIYCEGGAYRIGGQTLHDSHPFDNLTFKEIIAKSSNIGFAKVMSRLDSKVFYNYIKKFGFGSRLNLPINGASRGKVWHYKKWSGYSKSAIAMGHEIMASPLQMACAISTIANGGRKVSPRIVDEIRSEDGKIIKKYDIIIGQPLIHPLIARQLTRALEMVVSDEGTAKQASIEGVSVAGKTGTAQKLVNGRYSHSKYVSSFYGFLPSNKPKVSITIMVDEPNGKLYGGTVAAPAFSQMGERIINYLIPRPLASLFPNEENKDVA